MSAAADDTGSRRAWRWPLSSGVLPCAYFGFWTLYFGAFWWHALRHDAAGNLFAGHPGLWADWAFHFTLGNTMAHRALIPATSPLLLDASFSYPFAADLVSALLMRGGVPMVPAFVVPSFLVSLLLVFALFYFLRSLFRSGRVAALGASLFLFTGGSGFVRLAADAALSADPLATLLHPVRSYTLISEGANEMFSIIESMVVPQRGFSLGFALALIALGFLHSTLRKPSAGLDRRDRIKLVLASVVLGAMPVIHAHSFLAVFAILSFWSVGHVLFSGSGTWLQRSAPWVAVAGITSLIAVPLILRFIAGHVDAGFFRWYPGWYAAQLDVNWLAFWLAGWSLTPFLAGVELVAMLKEQRTRQARSATLFTFLPFFVLFALANLFLFAPWIFDNTKLLAFAALGFSGLAARAILALWDGRRVPASDERGQAPDASSRKATRFARTVAVLLVGAVAASGAIDAYRVLRVDLRSHEMYSREEIELARWARETTPAESVWLTGDRHLHWVTNLTGRQVVMAFRGWLWSHGYRYGETERDVGRMFATADPDLLRKYRIDYVVIGPDERSTWRADERRFAHYPVVQRTASTTVFRVR